MYLEHGGEAARTAIMIYNATGSVMRFRLNHDIQGSAQTPFPETIDNGKWGLALHGKQQHASYASEGYAVYTVHYGAGQTCDVCFGFMAFVLGGRWVNVRHFLEAGKRYAPRLLTCGLVRSIVSPRQSCGVCLLKDVADCYRR